MEEVKKISLKLLLLIGDLLMIAVNVARQIIFPKKGQKGNILSSILLLFVNAVNRIRFFEHGTFKMAVVFNNKYFSKAILIIGIFLFLLSSLEWSTQTHNHLASPVFNTERLSARETVCIGKCNVERQLYPTACLFYTLPKEKDKYRYPTYFVYPLTVKKFLQTHRLLI